MLRKAFQQIEVDWDLQLQKVHVRNLTWESLKYFAEGEVAEPSPGRRCHTFLPVAASCLGLCLSSASTV